MSAFHLDDAGNVAVLTFDQPGAKVNTLGTGTLTELGDVAAQLAQRLDLRGLIVRSGKAGQCIAGADLKEVARLAEGPAEELAAFIDLGHRAFGQLAALPFPTVGLVDGPALGGGLELLLAIDARVVTDHPRTALGLPEVSLGLIPAWGGTQRLPRTIDFQEAVRRLTTGLPFTADEAAAAGLVERVAALDQGDAACREVLERLRREDRWQLQRARLNRPLRLAEDQSADHSGDSLRRALSACEHRPNR